MPTWTAQYYKSLRDQFTKLTAGLDSRLDRVVQGREAPSSDAIPIGSARKLDASVLVFDIREFSKRTTSSSDSALKEALLLLDSVLPTVAQVIYDYNGYVEKNTGDGVMAILGAGADANTRATLGIECALTIKYALKHFVNDYLVSKGVPKVEFRIGVDQGPILLARIGTPTGTAKQERNFLTAVGPTANIATRLQQKAGTDQIWIGNSVRTNLPERRQNFCKDVTPFGWTWTAGGQRYRVWNYDAEWKDPK